MAMGPRRGVELIAGCLLRRSAACRSAAGRPPSEPPLLPRLELCAACYLNAGLPKSLRPSRYCSVPPFALRHLSGAPRLMISKFCTVAGDLSGTKAGLDSEPPLDLSNGLKNKMLSVGLGNAQELLQRIKSETSKMKAMIIDFEPSYNKDIRPKLASSCLLAPGPITDPWTVFLHRQTFKIANVNPSYLSPFDIMSYKYGWKDFQWDMLERYLVQRRIYIIDDWESSLSTIETLIYDHGLKEPDDGTDIPFYKGECDASYDEHTKTANLSYMLWDDEKKIKHSEVLLSVKCSSATEAKIFAALALLYKAKELGCQKLLLCCNSQTVIKILNGELAIGKNHKHCDLYLMLRSSRILFQWLVLSWRPES